MKIRFVESSSSQHQSLQHKSQEFEAQELIIGRGGRSTLVITHRSLSLEHVSLTESANGLEVKDLGSLTGIQHNGRIVRQAVLQHNDTLTLGSFELQIYFESGVWILHHEKTEDEISDVSALTSRLHILSYLPPVTRLSLYVVIVIAFIYILLPLLSKKSIETHSVGSLTKHHSFLAHDCAACHTNSFQPASDKGCLDCHSVGTHYDSKQEKLSSFAPHNLNGDKNCLSCHSEHKGHVTYDDNRNCTSCHANIESINDISLKNVESWLTHPEFSVKQDKGEIKLNHHVHLKEGLRGDKGPETLQCSSCHTLDDNGTRMKPITYETNCSRCHSLEFSERLPGKVVPHGDADEVIRYLQQNFAEAALDRTSAPAKGDSDRLIPLQKQNELLFEQQSVIKEVNDTSKIVFTKTGCALCHTVSEVMSTDSKLPTKYEIKKGAIQNEWLSKSTFAHSQHGQIDCNSCHKDVQISKSSKDVLMPKKSDCLDCHAKSESLSSCITCHNFHDEQPLNLLMSPTFRKDANK
jgi:hypothetical protein